jgi:nitroreductase
VTLTALEALATTRSVRRRLDLDRDVSPDLLVECVRVAQQAPSASNRQTFHFVLVTDTKQRAALGELFCRGLENYRHRPDGLYQTQRGSQEDDHRRQRIIASLEHLASHIDRVPVHVIPCVEGTLEPAALAQTSAMMGSVMPAAWSFALAARAQGLGTCWTTLHLQFPNEANAILGLPDDVLQVALLPTAHTIGTKFSPAHRRPLDDIVHWQRL